MGKIKLRWNIWLDLINEQSNLKIDFKKFRRDKFS